MAEATSDRAVGRAEPRREDFALLTGAGCFVDDLALDPLEPVPDAAAALAANAPSVHEGRPNLYLESRLEAGEVDAAFAQAEAAVERTFRHARVNASPIEPRGALAEPSEDGVK